MRAAPAENISNHPDSLLLVQSYYSAMRNRRGESSIRVMLGVQDVPISSALPYIHLWAHVRRESKKLTRINLTDFFSVDADSVVIGSRAKQVSLLFIGSVDVRTGITKKGPVKGKQLYRQRVGVRVRAATSRAVVSAVNY